MSIESLPSMLLKCLEQYKMWHWTCEKFSTHKVLDGLYEEMYELADRLAESLRGQGKELKTIEYSVETFKSVEVCQDKLRIKSQLMDSLIEEEDLSEDLQNILAEIQEVCNKNIFLLGLK